MFFFLFLDFLGEIFVIEVFVFFGGDFLEEGAKVTRSSVLGAKNGGIQEGTGGNFRMEWI